LLALRAPQEVLMENDLKRLTTFLKDLGIDGVGHTNKTYLAHVVSLYRYLKEHGASEEVAQAGLFHSIYGTEIFQGFKLPVERRDDIRALIGERAERLAYLNCAMDRATFDRVVGQAGGPYRFVDRLTREAVELSQRDFDDVCRIHLYDWLEQVGRAEKWDYRRKEYRALAERLGEAACAEFDRVYGDETAGQRAQSLR
jgi:hypothetical protein